MGRRWSAGLLLLAGLALLAAQAREPSREVSDDTRQLLRQFVDELVAITPGEGPFPQSFAMGTTAQPAAQPTHTVTFAHSFRMAKYEVPQNLYEAVMGANPSRWQGPRNSAEQMTWVEAREFCQQLTALLQTEQLITADEVIRLPSEAEWEYCCRAGSTTVYSFGDAPLLLDEYAWHTGNAAGNDPAVGALKPNPWGLYDMHGYLWEYCADNWHDDYTGAPVDGSAWTSIGERVQVLRGGSWRDDASQLDSGFRRPVVRKAASDAVGFRCVKARRR